MVIRVSEIADEGLVVANPGEFVAPFADRSWRLQGLRLQVVRDGVDILVAGELAASVPLVCSRCLEEFRADVHPAIDVRYVPKPVTRDSVELGADDLDLDFYQNDELNLAALVETETTLALPVKPLCREDCRGLCPACGGNRNVVSCTCQTRPLDPRLTALKDLVARLNH
ncbi:MAG TPA: DUF177 domain-containing protein [Methylomirabilota bacterium]|jgi:uncharacterized protein|nr:DUF177 domain-containing protein [Methylomirabilota bacterium]